jgi:hypothetical protein
MDTELVTDVLVVETPAPDPPAPEPPAPDPLAEENARLREENRRLRAEGKRREIATLLSELREGGQLTPAMEYAGLEAALVSAEEQGLAVQLPGGQTLPFASVLRDVLRAIPCSYVAGCCCQGEEQIELGAQLSADEKRIAQSLGLSMEEFAEIRNA